MPEGETAKHSTRLLGFAERWKKKKQTNKNLDTSPASGFTRPGGVDMQPAWWTAISAPTHLHSGCRCSVCATLHEPALEMQPPIDTKQYR